MNIKKTKTIGIRTDDHFLKLLESASKIVRRQSFWYQSWFKLSESLAHLVNYTMLRACCDASVALRMSFV